MQRSVRRGGGEQDSRPWFRRQLSRRRSGEDDSMSTLSGRLRDIIMGEDLEAQRSISCRVWFAVCFAGLIPLGGHVYNHVTAVRASSVLMCTIFDAESSI